MINLKGNMFIFFQLVGCLRNYRNVLLLFENRETEKEEKCLEWLRGKFCARRRFPHKSPKTLTERLRDLTKNSKIKNTVLFRVLWYSSKYYIQYMQKSFLKNTKKNIKGDRDCPVVIIFFYIQNLDTFFFKIYLKSFQGFNY